MVASETICGFWRRRSGSENVSRLAEFVAATTCPALLLSYEKALVFPEPFLDAMTKVCGVPLSDDLRRRLMLQVMPNAPDYITPDYITPDYITPDYITPDYITPDYITPDYITPDYITPENITPDYITPDYITPDYITPDYITPEIHQQGAPSVRRLHRPSPRRQAARLVLPDRLGGTGRARSLPQRHEAVTSPANLFRPDLAPAGFGSGNSGFSLDLAPLNLPPQTTLRIIVSGRTFGLANSGRALADYA